MARVVLPGVAQHVTQRGVRSMAIFDADRREYLRLLREQGERVDVRFLAYCLMTDHAHLVAIPAEQESLARGIGEAHHWGCCGSGAGRAGRAGASSSSGGPRL